MHKGEPEVMSLLEVDAYLNQNDIIHVLEYVSLNAQPQPRFLG